MSLTDPRRVRPPRVCTATRCSPWTSSAPRPMGFIAPGGGGRVPFAVRCGGRRRPVGRRGRRRRRAPGFVSGSRFGGGRRGPVGPAAQRAPVGCRGFGEHRRGGSLDLFPVGRRGFGLPL